MFDPVTDSQDLEEELFVHRLQIHFCGLSRWIRERAQALMVTASFWS